VGRGPTGKELEFTFQKRNQLDTMDELGRVIFNLTQIVPAGIVCFFPSYAYEKQVLSRWQLTGQLEKIHQNKVVFREPKSAAQVDSVLSEYSALCREAKSTSGKASGALLSSVVGGKMSEGINFSDELAR